MAKKPVGVWGIDLGQCGLKAIRLEEQDGAVVATAFDLVEHPKILSQPDADPDQLTREALEKFLSHNAIKGDIVCISVPGQSGLARFVKLPPVEEKKIGDIVKFEAKQQIPFNLDEVVWDYQKIGAGMVTDGFALDTEIGLFAMKRDAVNKYLQHFKDVQVDVHIVQMAPLALCNYVAYDLLKKEAGPAEDDSGKRTAIVALDIGSDASNLVITDGVRIIWQRPIPLGGNHFTRALTKDLKLTFAKAEHLKRNAMKSPELKKILASIKPVLTDFVSEVQRSLGYFTNTHRDVQIQYMMGLGNAFRLPGLQRFLAEKLQLDVRKMEKLQRLGGSGVVDAPLFNENILSFGVAYGLAVQGLEKARLLTNLLPPEIKMERLIKAKKPWAIAAAAVLLLSVGALAFGYGRQYSAYVGEDIKKARKRGQDAQSHITAAQKKYDDARSAAENEQKGIASIVAGAPEQINWLELCKFIDEVVPRAEDAYKKGALPDSAAQYLDGAREAYEKEYAPWRSGAGSKRSGEDNLADGLERLIHFNIEAVSCRFSRKLSDFWARLPKDVKSAERSFVLPAGDLAQPPGENDKGWVVELRGYTYHKDKSAFLINVLLQNIARKAVERGDWKPKPEAAPETAPVQPAGQPGGGQGGMVNPQQRAVSHVVLYNTGYKGANTLTPFDIIKDSKLGLVVTNTAAASSSTSGGPGGGPGGPGGGPGGPGGLGAGAGGLGAGGLGGGTGGSASQDNWKQLGSEALVSPASSPAKSDGKPDTGGTPSVAPRYERTEFVIFFIWREQTPSDSSFKLKPATQPDSATPGGGPGFGQGGGPGMGQQGGRR